MGGTKGWCKGQEKCTYNRCTDPPLANMASNKKKRFLHHLLVKIVFNKFTIYKRSIHCWSWTQDTKYNFLVNSWMDLLSGNKKLIFKIRKIIPWKYILVSPSWNVLLFAFPAKYCVGDGFEKFAQVLEGFPKYSEEHQNTPRMVESNITFKMDKSFLPSRLCLLLSPFGNNAICCKHSI